MKQKYCICKFSPGTGAGCRPPADEPYGRQKDAPEPPTAPTAQRGGEEGREVLGNDAVITLNLIREQNCRRDVPPLSGLKY